MSNPDYAKLRQVAAEVATLRAAERWDEAAFRRLYAAAEAAVDGQRLLLEFIINSAEPEWLSRPSGATA